MAGGIAPPASCRGAYHARSPTTSERQTRCRQAASAPVGRGHTGEPQRRLPERRGPERRHPVRARTRWARWCPGEPGGSGWRPGWTPHRGRGHGVPGGQGGTGALSQGAAGGGGAPGGRSACGNAALGGACSIAIFAHPGGQLTLRETRSITGRAAAPEAGGQRPVRRAGRARRPAGAGAGAGRRTRLPMRLRRRGLRRALDRHRLCR